MYSSNFSYGSGSAGWKRLLCAVPFLLLGCGVMAQIPQSIIELGEPIYRVQWSGSYLQEEDPNKPAIDVVTGQVIFNSWTTLEHRMERIEFSRDTFIYARDQMMDFVKVLHKHGGVDKITVTNIVFEEPIEFFPEAEHYHFEVVKPCKK